MNRHSQAKDRTAQRNAGGGGSDMRILWLCGCKATRKAGAVVKRGVMVRCDQCAKGRP